MTPHIQLQLGTDDFARALRQALDAGTTAQVGVGKPLSAALTALLDDAGQVKAVGPLTATPRLRPLKLVDDATNKGRKDLPRSDAETVLDWAEETKYPGARATPGDVTGNHPGTAWDGTPHIHIPGAGRGGHVPVGPGVGPRGS